MRFETSNLFAFLVKKFEFETFWFQRFEFETFWLQRFDTWDSTSWDFEVILNQYDGLHWLPERNKMEGKSIKWLQKLFFIRKSESYRGEAEAGIKHVSQTTGTVELWGEWSENQSKQSRSFSFSSWTRIILKQWSVKKEIVTWPLKQCSKWAVCQRHSSKRPAFHWRVYWCRNLE